MAPQENGGNSSNTEETKEILEPRDTDVLCGRGGAALRHPGNQTYRKLVELNKLLYTTCPKTEKLKISRSIVAAIREQNGRFLERKKGKEFWLDIGDKKAVEKTSQALREGQPKLRAEIYGQNQNGIYTTRATDQTVPNVSIDGMSDIGMVDSQFSLLSGINTTATGTSTSNAADTTSSSMMAISTHNGGRKDSMGSEYLGVGSRRSLMSGLSKLSGHTFDMTSTLSNRKASNATNHTTSSRSLMSQFSCIGEDDFAEEKFDWDIPQK
eukprot:jgi/Psemu1/324180/estExt_fgenesh1_pg.C_1240025